MKKQLFDYEKRVGKSSSLYKKTKSQLTTHCKAPIAYNPKTNKNSLLSLKNEPANGAGKASADKNVVVGVQPTQPSDVITNILWAPFLTYWPWGVGLFIFLCLAGLVKTPRFKGFIGEWVVKCFLKRHLLSADYIVLNDITLPLDGGKGTTQIDHLVLSCYGLFVIETKHMTGWIFGEEKGRIWTQVIFANKVSFQNPIRQNYRHICELAALLGLDKSMLVSLIAFVGDVHFKTDMPEYVGHPKQLLAYIKSFDEEIFSAEQRHDFEATIERNRLPRGRKTNKAHIKYLQKHHS
ncbi:nuclease-related domain-containing protein [Thalassotalea fonticola]|uniref:Nuclease-related domain-containing protein n=1 Tax=Thalassotalea fonticola TaxID=3065649 RepID=A0ABZ0GUB9_9GAMM|nr:nuclease-related domain-containing protein [Colwelliaceae bacterium S1-1]